MPSFIAMLLGGLVNIAGSITGRVLIALGLGVATYTGLSTSLAWLKSQAISSLTGAPAQLVQLIAFLGVGESISIITSAILVRMTINGLQSDTLRKFVLT